MATAQTATSTAKDPWEVEVPASGGDFALCPTGNYSATVVALVDVGHHEKQNDKGETYLSRQLVIAVELKKLQPDGKPFVLVEQYTYSMSDRSNLFKLVTNLTGTKRNQGDKFSPTTLLGVPVLVGVVHGTSAKKKTYHKIGSITTLPEDMTPPVPTRKPYAWTVTSSEPIPAFDDLPFVFGTPIKSLCEQSDERRGQSGKSEDDDDGADKIPF